MNRAMLIWMSLGIVSILASLVSVAFAQATHSLWLVALAYAFIACLFICVGKYFSAYGRFIFRGGRKRG